MKPYQCHNRPPFKTETVLQDHHGRVVSQWPAVMAKDCRYTHTELGQADTRRKLLALGLWPKALPLQNLSTGEDFELTRKNRT